jgi:hypothetical protein
LIQRPGTGHRGLTVIRDSLPGLGSKRQKEKKQFDYQMPVLKEYSTGYASGGRRWGLYAPVNNVNKAGIC